VNLVDRFVIGIFLNHDIVFLTLFHTKKGKELHNHD